MQLLFIVVLILLLLALPLVLLRIISPGKTPPIRDTKGKLVTGSIAVIERVSIGGTEQAMIIRGHNVKNPVLLYLHGGPGTPEFAFIRKEFTELEKHFTICYWEQRGAGKSAKWKLPTANVTLEQLVNDAGEVAVYLEQRFKTGRIYLLGHSWGTVLGAHTANAFPELFAAYIGIGQVGDQYEGEKLSLEFVRDQAKQLKHTSVPAKVRTLQLPERNAPAHVWIPYLLAQRRWVAEFGGALFRTNMNKTAPRQLITCTEYTVREKLNFVTAAKHSMHALWESVITENLADLVPELRIPVYIIQGIHDYQTPTAEARRFYDQLQAPHKAWYELEEAAHFPHTECYRQTETILLNDVLKPNQLNN
jgi:pimeloyl-ACP methyl ester carboxylesterase